MKKRRLFIFITMTSFVLALSAFQQPLAFSSASDTDTLKINLPANFPNPVYNFKKNPVTKAGFELGKTLFYAPLLSSDQLVSCSSCHRASGAFSNFDVALSSGVNGCKGDRNAPALFNLAWQKEFMWDGRIGNLEDVPTNALTNPCEMNNNMDSILIVLRRDPSYPDLFQKAFGQSGITEKTLLSALAQFTSMMISANSKYDKYTRKEEGGNFTTEETAGYLLFKQECSSCHTEPLFTDGSYRSNGLDLVAKDRGRDSLTKVAADKGKFRVPSLRNIEITKPYMHDGRFASLKQVLAHYNNGVKNHANLDPLLKKGGKMGISLTQLQQAQLIAFLKTLTDVDFINDRRFNNH